jgi:hypothetical protein
MRRTERTSRNPNEFKPIKRNGVVNLIAPSAVEHWCTTGIPYLIYITEKTVLVDLYGE